MADTRLSGGPSKYLYENFYHGFRCFTFMTKLDVSLYQEFLYHRFFDDFLVK